MLSADQLPDLLAKMRQALQRGDLAALEPLSRQLDAAITALTERPAAPDLLQAIRHSAVETEGLLDAASRGIGAARRRLTEIAAVRRGLVTYAGDGQRQVIGTATTASRRV